MIEPSLALQRAVYDRLRADPGVVALVPADHVFDRHGLPTVSPCVILGDDQTIRDPLSLADDSFRVALTLHVWARGTNVVEVKRIAGAIVTALRGDPPAVEGHRLAWLHPEQGRYLRDPGGEWAHAALSFEAMLVETTS